MLNGVLKLHLSCKLILMRKWSAYNAVLKDNACRSLNMYIIFFCHYVFTIINIFN